jgi:hypothetical protein
MADLLAKQIFSMIQATQLDYSGLYVLILLILMNVLLLWHFTM